MTYEQWKDLIPLIFGQMTLLAVQVIHAWTAGQRYRQRRDSQKNGEGS